VARAIGPVGRILEEGEQPMVVELWRRAGHEALALLHHGT
jgi:hypothetical protein